MCVQRPIHVSTGITRTSWYRLMRPVKEKNNSIDGFEVCGECGGCVKGSVYVGVGVCVW